MNKCHNCQRSIDTLQAAYADRLGNEYCDSNCYNESTGVISWREYNLMTPALMDYIAACVANKTEQNLIYNARNLPDEVIDDLVWHTEQDIKKLLVSLLKLNEK